NPSGTFASGQGWMIHDKYMVDGSAMYAVKNSKGAIYYITANKKYVAVKGNTTKPKVTYHTVAAGDTVSELALRYKTTVANIRKWNKLEDVNKIYVGQELRVK